MEKKLILEKNNNGERRMMMESGKKIEKNRSVSDDLQVTV